MLILNSSFKHCTAISTLVLSLAPLSLVAQGTAILNPLHPARGSSATISYDATGGPLELESSVVATVGFNGFQNLTDIPLSGTSPNFTGIISNIPNNATSIDIVFKDPGGNIFDNNGAVGADWQFLTAETLTLEPGAQKVDGPEGGGFLFRVWAPDVSSMSVVGDFNGFDGRLNQMVQDPATGIWGAHIPNAVADQEYKYLMDGTEFRRDPRGRAVRGAFDNSVLVDTTTFTFNHPRIGAMDEFRDWVIYEIHIGTLDPADGTAPGTFNDLIPERLDYIADLNFNAIHVMPINEFPGATSGGYNLTEPFAIERDYGTPEDFRNFVDECHARGIAVIVDIVHNHYGPGGLDIYDFQDLNRNALRDEPGIYFYDGPELLAETNFGPRPDYSEPQVRDFITDSVTELINVYNVDGFRWDFTKAMRAQVNPDFSLGAEIPEGISLLQDINSNILAPNPDLISIAEDLDGDARLTNPVIAVTGNPNDNYGFDTQWDSNFHGIMVNQMLQTLDINLDMGAVAVALNGDFNRLHYIESHDLVWEINNNDRVPTRIDPADPESLRARKMSALGAGVLLTSEGVPMIFQGSEILDNGGADNSWNDDEPIDFSRLADPHISGFRDLYADLIALRRNLGGATAGLLGDDTVPYNIDNFSKVITYSRSNGGSAPGDTVVVIANFSSTDFSGGYDIGLPSAGSWYEVFNSDDTSYGADFGGVGVDQTVESEPTGLHGFPQRGTVSIAPRSMVILSQESAAETETGEWILLH